MSEQLGCCCFASDLRLVSSNALVWITDQAASMLACGGSGWDHCQVWQLSQSLQKLLAFLSGLWIPADLDCLWLGGSTWCSLLTPPPISLNSDPVPESMGEAGISLTSFPQRFCSTKKGHHAPPALRWIHRDRPTSPKMSPLPRCLSEYNQLSPKASSIPPSVLFRTLILHLFVQHKRISWPETNDQALPSLRFNSQSMESFYKST